MLGAAALIASARERSWVTLASEGQNGSRRLIVSALEGDIPMTTYVGPLGGNSVCSKIPKQKSSAKFAKELQIQVLGGFLNRGYFVWSKKDTLKSFSE